MLQHITVAGLQYNRKVTRSAVEGDQLLKRFRHIINVHKTALISLPLSSLSEHIELRVRDSLLSSRYGSIY